MSEEGGLSDDKCNAGLMCLQRRTTNGSPSRASVLHFLNTSQSDSLCQGRSTAWVQGGEGSMDVQVTALEAGARGTLCTSMDTVLGKLL